MKKGTLHIHDLLATPTNVWLFELVVFLRKSKSVCLDRMDQCIQKATCMYTYTYMYWYVYYVF